MGSIGTNNSSLPRYSNAEGTILTSTVKADSRYAGLQEIFNDFTTKGKGHGYLAEDFLRSMMYEEEKGNDTGTLYIHIWNEESLRDKMNTYKKALKSIGYKVTSQTNNDRHSPGYVGVRGKRVYASTSRARTLYWEKIKK